MSGKTTNLKRRNFLLSLGVGGAGAAAGAIGGKAILTRQAGPTAKEPSSKGYRLSEHVQNYYRTMRV